MSRLTSHDSVVQEIKAVADIVEIIGAAVTLQKNGVNYKGLCPFHNEKTPSFHVNPERRSFHCFGCGEGGDIFSFLMRHQGLSFPEAIKELAGRYHIPLPEKELTGVEREQARKRSLLHEIGAAASLVYHEFLRQDPAAAAARRYLQERGVPPEAIASFQLGFAPESWDFLGRRLGATFAAEDICEAGLTVEKEKGGYYDRFRNRILFPILSLSGKIVAFGGRILGEGQPKYLNSPETPVYNKSTTLFGLYQHREQIRKEKRCIIVEGNFDLLTLVIHGFANVVAPLGTALTQQQVRSLKTYAEEAILLFDGDQAGLKAAMRCVPFFLTEQLPARIVILPEEEDPDTYLRRHGAEALRQLLASARSMPEFVLEQLIAKHTLSLEGKGRIVAELQPLVKAIGNRHLQRTIFLAHFGEKLGVTPEQLLGGLDLAAAALSPPPPSPLAAPAHAPREARGGSNLPPQHERLLEFLLLYPEFFPQFMDSGLGLVITHPLGIAMLAHMQKLAATEGSLVPERLLDSALGPERTLISKLLTAAPSYPDQAKEEEAAEKLSWVREYGLKQQLKALTAEINAAQASQDQTLLMELLAKKIAINEVLAA